MGDDYLIAASESPKYYYYGRDISFAILLLYFFTLTKASPGDARRQGYILLSFHKLIYLTKIITIRYLRFYYIIHIVYHFVPIYLPSHILC